MVQTQDNSPNKATLTAYKLLYGMENDRKHCGYLFSMSYSFLFHSFTPYFQYPSQKFRGERI